MVKVLDATTRKEQFRAADMIEAADEVSPGVYEVHILQLLIIGEGFIAERIADGLSGDTEEVLFIYRLQEDPKAPGRWTIRVIRGDSGIEAQHSWGAASKMAAFASLWDSVAPYGWER